MQGPKNVMEIIVSQKLEEIKGKLDSCTCEKCLQDIVTYALNLLPPRYVSTHTGELYSKLDTLSIQKDVDVTSVLFKAAERIGQNPRH